LSAQQAVGLDRAGLRMRFERARIQPGISCGGTGSSYMWGMRDKVHIAGALVPAAGQERIVRRGFWNKVRSTLGKIPFTEQAVAAFYCATDGRTPVRVKAVLFAALAYFVLPADMIPDFALGLGFTDDATVLLAAMSALAPYVTEAHFERARSFLAKDVS
jgi:uncharacterized membrane protein YkvA (DUF1232 family)